jgi:hypothetical protein
MNDVMDLLEEFCAQVPDPTVEVRTAARDLLVQEMAKQKHGRRHLLDLSQITRLSSRKQRVVTLIGAFVAAAVLIAVLVPRSTVPSKPITSPPKGGTSAASTFLLSLAKIVETSPHSVIPGPGQYLYVETYSTSVGGQSDGSTYLYERQGATLQTWVNSIGIGRELQTPNPTVTWLTPGGAAAWAPVQARLLHQCQLDPGRTCTPQQFDSPVPIPAIDGAWSSNSVLTFPNNVDLPTNPTTLRETILSWNSSHGFSNKDPVSAQLIEAVESDIQAGASPALVSAIYQMISKISGIKLLGHTIDDKGITGVAIGYNETNHTGQQDQLIFNPKTGALLEYKIVQIAKATPLIAGFAATSPPVGTVDSSTLFEASRVVDAIPTAASGAER